MPYLASVFRVMITSPSDAPETRIAVEQTILDWNIQNSLRTGVLLQPRVWESAEADEGGAAQQVINSQGVDESDIVFALFGGRLGTPTLSAVSGILAEFDRALALGRCVHIYFSRELLPHDVAGTHIEAIRVFKRQIQERGLLGDFNSPGQLRREVWRAIDQDIAAFVAEQTASDRSERKRVEFVVQPGQEREVSGVYATGAPRYRTKDWLDVSNVGERDAEVVTFEALLDGGHVRLLAPKNPTTIHRGQSRRLPVVYPTGGSEGARLRVRWVEDGESREHDFHIG